MGFSSSRCWNYFIQSRHQITVCVSYICRAGTCELGRRDLSFIERGSVSASIASSARWAMKTLHLSIISGHIPTYRPNFHASSCMSLFICTHDIQRIECAPPPQLLHSRTIDSDLASLSCIFILSYPPLLPRGLDPLCTVPYFVSVFLSTSYCTWPTIQSGRQSGQSVALSELSWTRHTRHTWAIMLLFYLS